MLLIETTMIQGDAEIQVTIDADKVAVFVNGGEKNTGLLLDSGESIVLKHDYDDLMKEIVEAAGED